MIEHLWDDLLTEQDEQVISKGGFDESGASAVWDSRGFGERPALLVIDVQTKNTGPNEPIIDAIDASPTAMGTLAWQALEHIQRLLAAARNTDVPVIYTRSVPPAYDDPTHPDLDIVEAIAPAEDDPVIDKAYASPFNRTDIISLLTQQRIDTVVVTGGTTSGCVRATVVDAQSHGYSVVVPHECTFDRIDASHRVGLLDMWMKYAEVLDRDEVERYFAESAD